MELGLALAAMAAAALRAASTIAPRGLERAIVVVPIGVCAACLESLTLGLAGLGSDPHVLSAAALVTFLAALALPAPEVGPFRELVGWWRGLSASERGALGAAAGLGGAVAGWMLRYPLLGTDAVNYRLPTVLAWLDSGRPGAGYDASVDFATGSYPLGNELILHWPMAISRSFVAAGLITPGAVALIVTAGWYGLRTLGVSKAVSALAVAAVVALPANVRFLNGPSSDAVALAFAVCCAALCAGAARRPALLGPALLAAGLAISVKTTVVVPLALALAFGAWSARGALWPARRLLGLCAVAGAVVGGLWYVRNLVVHGSPLYPFRSTPWGDPSPPLLEALDHSLLERPRATLSGNWALYERELAGGLALMAGALLAPLTDRSRAAWTATAAAILGVLAYAAAPVTGAGDAGLAEFPVLSLRYLVPALAVCALAVAVASRAGRRRAVPAGAVLAAALAWSVWRSVELGFPVLPSVWTCLIGAGAGALAGLAAGWAMERDWPLSLSRRPASLAAALLALSVGASLALPADGFVRRNARLEAAPAPAIPRFFVSRDAPPESVPVHFSSVVDARVAGDRLRRPLHLLPRDLSCAGFRRRGWAVFTTSPAVLNRSTRLRLMPGPVERCMYSDPPVGGVPGVSAIFPPPRNVKSTDVPFPGSPR